MPVVLRKQAQWLINEFEPIHCHKHIGSNIKLRLDRQGKVDDKRSNVDEKEGLVRAILSTKLVIRTTSQ